MQLGRLRKLFLDKSNISSEDKSPNSTGNSSSDKLRPLRSSCLKFVKDHNSEGKVTNLCAWSFWVISMMRMVLHIQVTA
jgi:hypothetical protein